MRILIAEDESTSRQLLAAHLSGLGPCDAVENGEEAVERVRQALDAGHPYTLICLDIMMPYLDGHGAIKAIRALEHEHGILLGDGAKILMTTVLDDSKNIFGAFKANCDGYVLKPIDKAKLMEQLRALGLVGPDDRPAPGA
jgi:two-component system chemotaxis response regulator CheY